MYTTFIFSFTELTTAIPHAGGPFAYSRRAFGPTGGYIAGFATLIEFVFAPPAIALAIGAYLNVQFPALDPKLVALGAYVVFMTLNIVGVRHRRDLRAVRDAARDLRAAGLHGRGRARASRWPTSLQGRLGRRRRASAPPPCPGIFAAIPFAIWFFLAIEGVAMAAEEAQDPQPHDSDRLHQRHPDAGGAGLRRDGLRRRRRRLDASSPTSTTRCRRR